MPETNETYHPMTFDAIKIGLASPEKILIGPTAKLKSQRRSITEP